jgi:hypothetical protein
LKESLQAITSLCQNQAKALWPVLGSAAVTLFLLCFAGTLFLAAGFGFLAEAGFFLAAELTSWQESPSSLGLLPSLSYQHTLTARGIIFA